MFGGNSINPPPPSHPPHHINTTTTNSGNVGVVVGGGNSAVNLVIVNGSSPQPYQQQQPQHHPHHLTPPHPHLPLLPHSLHHQQPQQYQMMNMSGGGPPPGRPGGGGVIGGVGIPQPQQQPLLPPQSLSMPNSGLLYSSSTLTTTSSTAPLPPSQLPPTALQQQQQQQLSLSSQQQPLQQQQQPQTMVMNHIKRGGGGGGGIDDGYGSSLSSSIKSTGSNNTNTTVSSSSGPLDFLFNLTPVEVKDEYEEKMCRTYMMVQEIYQSKPSEQLVNEELNARAATSPAVHDDLVLGLITSMLVEPTNAQRYLQNTLMVARNEMIQYNACLLANEKFSRLHDLARKQLFWLARELLRNRTHGVELVYYGFFRHIPSGDLLPKTLETVASLLDTLIELRPAYEANCMLLSYAVFTFLRLIIDHANTLDHRVIHLRNKEIQFCHTLLRERFGDFVWLGRDFVRLLQHVSRLPEFEQLWHDLLNQPTVLGPKCSIVDLMRVRTPRRVMRLFITPELERKLLFMSNSVRFGNQNRYQSWLSAQYLSTPESQMLRPDLIRYICQMIHPPNDVLASGVLPRWAQCGWLLSNSLPPMVLAHCRLALFWDWFFYDSTDPSNHQHMDLEPGILVMLGSMKNYPHFSFALVDFLCRTINELHPPITHLLKRGVLNALTKIYEVNMASHMGQLFDCHRAEPELRKLIRDTLPELFTPELNHILLPPGSVVLPPQQQQQQQQPSQVPFMQQQQPSQSQQQPTQSGRSSTQSTLPQLQRQDSGGDQVTANFSDDEDDIIECSPAGSSSSSPVTSVITNLNFNSVPSGSGGSVAPPTKKLKKSNSFSNNIPLNTIPGGGSTTGNNNNGGGSSSTARNVPLMGGLGGGGGGGGGLIGNNNNNNSQQQLPPSSASLSATSSLSPQLITPPSTPITVASTSTTNELIISNAPVPLMNITTSTVINSNIAPLPMSYTPSISSLIPSSSSLATNTSSSSSSSSSSLPHHHYPHQQIQQQQQQSPQSSQHHESSVEYISNILNSSVLATPPPSANGSSSSEILHNNTNSINNDRYDDRIDDITQNNNNTNNATWNNINETGGGDIDGENGAELTENELLEQAINNISGVSAFSREELLQQIEHLDEEELKQCLKRLLLEKNKQIRCQEMQKLTTLLADVDDDNIEVYCSNLTLILLAILENDLAIRVFPFPYPFNGHYPPDADELRDSITGPLFEMFRTLVVGTPEEKIKSKRSTLLTLLAAMGTNNNKLGYLLLYYLIVSDNHRRMSFVYRYYAREMNKDLTELVLADLANCGNDDPWMFSYILPEVYANFGSQFSTASAMSELVKLIVSYCSARQLQPILNLVRRGQLKLIKKDPSVISLLTDSLEWESIDQTYLWRLILAHNISLDVLITLYPKLDYDEHSEALTALSELICKEPLTLTVLKHLFNRERKPNDDYTVSILLRWVEESPNKLAELIGTLVSGKISSPNKRTNKRTPNNQLKSSSHLNVDQILGYLDDMRRISLNNSKVINWFTQDNMLGVMYQVKQLYDNDNNHNFDQLFALTEVKNEAGTTGGSGSSGSSSSTSGSGGNSGGGGSSSSNSSSSSGTGNSGGNGGSSSSTTTNKRSTIGKNSKKQQNTTIDLGISKTRSGTPITRNDSETETDTDSDEEIIPVKTKSSTNLRKKRKTPVGSDSD